MRKKSRQKFFLPIAIYGKACYNMLMRVSREGVSDETGNKRVYMKESDDFDYEGFFDALKFIGCERVSIEAGTSDFAADAAEAIRVLNKYK